MDLVPNLSNRVALVTGASRGIGGAVARALAAAGADVAVNYRDRQTDAEAVAGDVRATGRRALAVQADVASIDAVAGMLRQVEAALGPVDVLVNNAGIAIIRGVDDLTEAEFDLTLAVNLKSVFLCTQAVIPGMRERKWGRVVNVLNIGAKAPGANSTPTSVSRAAGLALTKAMSQENAKHGVLVNAMLVGLIESDQWQRRHKTAAGAGKTYEEFLDGMAKGRIPLGRVGKAEEFARLACFLCSDAGSFITGVAINVDGGASPVV